MHSKRNLAARLLSIALLMGIQGATALAQPISPIPIRIPPPGIEVDAAQLKSLEQRLDAAQQLFLPKSIQSHSLAPDIGAVLKAVDLAIVNGEFYSPKDIAKAISLLELAELRIAQLKLGEHPWTRQHGLVVRGYRSAIDNSYQPYAVEIPAGLELDSDASTKLPLYVWLHGRGDKTTDLHFIHQRRTRAGRINPPGAIVVHPFGRHCMGFKSAGEIDVLDVVEEMTKHYPIDPDRVLLMGFSMGGAGAWHLGAHYADRWAAVSPGAGFAETARYTRLTPEQFPPWYEQILWGVHDAPNYVRNLFNIPVTAYSGEVDKQIQAARVMEEAYRSQGRELPHLIGPGMGHKYHPDTLKELMRRMRDAAKNGRPTSPRRVLLQTRTLRYGQQYWVQALRLKSHWSESRIDAQIQNQEIIVRTNNVQAFRLTPPGGLEGVTVVVDNTRLTSPTPLVSKTTFLRTGNKWQWVNNWNETPRAKRPGQQGPIDDAFMAPFLIVRPTGSQDQAVKRWVAFEIDHLLARWTTLYRARPLIKDDVDVTKNDLATRHIVAFGTPSSNDLLAQAFQHTSRPPIQWTTAELTVGDQTFDAATHLPILIYPNPLSPKKYLVVNSGPTHREAHDRTNSLQNPKLPDWAVLDISQDPSDATAGRVVAANFFDESWKLKPAGAR